MDRVTAWKTLSDMWGEASPEQREALTIAMNDVQFVDLAADDMAYVVRCKDCEYRDTGYCAFDCFDYEATDDAFCSYGKREATP